MKRLTMIVVLTACLLAPLATAAPARANPVASVVGGWLVDKFLDGIWDWVTGKPEVRKLDQRLKAVEAELARQRISPQSIQAVRDLRLSITSDTTYAEYLAMARQTTERIQAIEERLSDLEEEVTDLRQRVSTLETMRRPTMPPTYQTVGYDWYRSYRGPWQWSTVGYYYVMVNTPSGPVTYVYWVTYP